MNPKKLAALYARFFNVFGDMASISDNAPAELRTFWNENDHEQKIYWALASVADGAPVSVPENITALLRWAASRGAQFEQIANAIMAGRQPPKSIGTLLKNAYLAEADATRARVMEFLRTELAKY